MTKMSKTQFKNKLAGNGVKIEFEAKDKGCFASQRGLTMKFEIDEQVGKCLTVGSELFEIGNKLTTRVTNSFLGTIGKIVGNNLYVEVR